MRELRRTGLANADIAAVCDSRQDHAELAASEAETLFDRRPDVFASLEEMAERCRGLDAVDVVTEPYLHHAIACAAMEGGLHVMTEKPMGLTVKACRRMIDAAARHGRKLSVNENYRRDPVNRLIRQVIDRGLIGRPYRMVHHSVGGGDRIVITPWRHLKVRGGITLDVGVHYADIIRYYLGDAEAAFGRVEVVREVRYRPASPNRPYEFHKRRLAQMEESVRPTAEDVSTATIRMAGGATVDWMLDMAAKRMGYFKRVVYGTAGCIDCPGERNGRPATLHLDDREKSLVGREIMEALPDFDPDPVTSALFGPKATDYSFSPDEADLKILALEYHEFAEAILNDRPSEVDGVAGLKAVALIYAILESSAAGTSVRLEDVESGKVDAYQREIDEAIGV
jgi:predicted dehydrogenase